MENINVYNHDKGIQIQKKVYDPSHIAKQTF